MRQAARVLALALRTAGVEGASALSSSRIRALATRWGLVGHDWVIIKLVSTAVAAGGLLLYMGTLTLRSVSNGRWSAIRQRRIASRARRGHDLDTRRYWYGPSPQRRWAGERESP